MGKIVIGIFLESELTQINSEAILQIVMTRNLCEYAAIVEAIEDRRALYYFNNYAVS